MSNLTRNCSSLLAAIVIVLSSACNSASTDEVLLVRIVADNYQWHIYLPGDDGAFGTADDRLTLRDLHLPVSQRVRIELVSLDFIYSFNLPEYDIWEAAVPGVPMMVEFDSGPASASSLLGDQFCGFSHEQLLGQVIVHEPSDYVAWLKTVPIKTEQ